MAAQWTSPSPGRTMMSAAREPDHDSAPAPETHALTQDRHRERGDGERADIADRHRLGERDMGEGDEEGEAADHVKAAAHELERQAAGADHVDRPALVEKRGHGDQLEQVARPQDLDRPGSRRSGIW